MDTVISPYPNVGSHISKFLCRQPEDHAAVRAHNILAVFPAATDVLQISTASDSLHNWEQHHHYLGANPLPVWIDRAAIGIADFLAVSAIALCAAATQETCHLDLKFIFLVIPFFHIRTPDFSQ